MNIKKTIISATVALTMVAMIAPATAGALTVADLQAQINALMSQLATLQGSTTVSGSVPAFCAGITFSRNLRVGSTGSDVKCLQAILNLSASTQVSMTGAGSPGMETMTFGPKTLVAVKKWQASVGIIPAIQIGPMSRAKLNAWLGGSPMPSPSPTPTPTPVPMGAGLSVMLASDNPIAGTIVNGQALAKLVALTFTNGDNAPVNVTGLKLKRIGVSADASLTNVYLFNGSARLTDGAAVSSTMVNFNNSSGLFTVPSMGSSTIWVLADVSGTSGETIGMQLVSMSDVTTNASSVKGVFPVTGNLMTLATGTLAGVNFNATTTPAASSVDPQDAYTVWQNSVTVTTRAVDMTRISFRKTGSTSDTDLKDFKLYVDGVQVGSAMQLAKNAVGDSYVTFDLSAAPKRLEAGTRVIKVLANIVGGSSLTFTTHLWNVADATFVDTQYYANVLATANSSTFSKRSSGEQTINGGTVTFTKTTDSPSGDIVDGASNVVLGRWTLKAAGEKVKISTLNVRILFTNTVTTGDDTATSTSFKLRNGMLLANGVQVGSTTSTTDQAAGTQFSLGSSLIVDPATPVTLEFRADIYDNAGSNNDLDATDTLQAQIVGSSSNDNATGMVSSNTIDAPAGNVNANVVTDRQGSLTLSKYTAYTDQSVVAPLTNFKLGHYTLTAATAEAVNLTAINMTLSSVSTYMTNLYVKYGTQTTSVKPTVTASPAWSINYTLPAGQTIDVMVFADVASGMNSGTGSVTLEVDGTTANSAVSSNSSTVTSQTLTYTSGSLATSFDGSPQNQIVSGNQSVFAGRFKLTSSYQNYTATVMRFKTGSSLPISSATLKDAVTGATIATVPYDNTNSYFNFTGLSVAIPASTSKKVDIYWNLSVPSATNSSTNVNTVATLDYVKYADPNGTETEDGTDRTGNETYVFKAVPVVTQVPVSSTAALINGATYDLYKFTVAAPTQGPVDVKQFKLDLNWSDGGGNNDALELESLKLLKDGVDITSSVSIVNSTTGSTAESTNGVSEADSKVIVTWDGATEDTISAGTTTTYTLRGVPQGFNVTATVSTAAATDSVSLGFTPDASHQTAGYNYLNAGTTQTGVMKLYSSATANASAAAANLIWSDESAVAHSASTTAGTGDWSNSYLFSNVGTQSWHD